MKGYAFKKTLPEAATIAAMLGIATEDVIVIVSVPDYSVTIKIPDEVTPTAPQKLQIVQYLKQCLAYGAYFEGVEP